MTYFPTISTFFQMNLETPNPQTDINDNNDSKRRHEDHLTALRSTIARLQRQEMESTEKIERVESELENENLTESERAELANAQTMWYGKLAAVNERLKQLRVSLASHEEEQERKVKQEKEKRKEIEIEFNMRQKKEQAEDRRLQSLLRLKPKKLTIEDPAMAEEFIKDFLQFAEIHLRSESERRTLIPSLLQHSMKDEPGHSVFLQKIANGKIRFWDLIELKREFLNHYAGL